MDKGFSASNLVLGIGSYTYEYVTRDTFGFAMKATYVEVNGEPRNIFKKPKTDKDNFKKSATGLLNVYMENDVLKLEEQCNLDNMKPSAMETVFLNGKISFCLSNVIESP
jgi:nicotinamide phosphoribosyltransferase